MRDLKFAIRQLLKNPGFSFLAVLTLAVGIAGATTAFSLFNGVFLNPLPIPNQGRVVLLEEMDSQSLRSRSASYNAFYAWQQHSRTFEHLGFCSYWGANLTSESGAVERVNMLLASADFINVLGLRPELGRTFSKEEDKPGGPNVVMISDRLWERLFARKPDVLGQIIKLDDDPYTIIGVLPPEADFPEPKDVWRPLRADPIKGHDGMGSMAMGRIKTGFSIADAREELKQIHRAWIHEYPQTTETIPRVTPVTDMVQRVANQYRFGLKVLLGVLGFVLVMACCNVTSIMLARGTSRLKELALRVALGATRRHIIQQVLCESLLLSVAGGALGIALGSYALRVLLSNLTEIVPSWMSFELDTRIVVFCLIVVGLATVLSGLLPSLHAAAPQNIAGVLQSAGAHATPSRSRRRTLSAVVATEVPLAMTLLIGAGLLFRTFRQVQAIAPGFKPKNLLTYNMTLPFGAYLDEVKRRDFWDRHLAKIRALPGVAQAALSDYLPTTWPSFERFESDRMVTESADGNGMSLQTQKTSPNFFTTMKIRLLAGRAFNEQDNYPSAKPLAVINQAAARQLWPNSDPIGRRLRSKGSEKWAQVVGVVENVFNSGLEDPKWPTVYYPVGSDISFGLFVIVKTKHNPMALMPTIRELVHTEDPELTIEDIQLMTQRIAKSNWLRRIIAWVFGVPAVAATIMAFAGIYGIFSYSASQRTQEIGIRIAMGASKNNVISMVLRQGLRLILIGLSFGVVGGFCLSQLFLSIPGMLHDVVPTDPVTFIVGFLTLTLVAMFAAYIPARRAAGTDPMVSLRHE